MKKKLAYLFFLGCLILQIQANSQTIQDLCPGDPPTWCTVEGLPSSTFEWWAQGAQELENEGNRVLLRWKKSGIYSLKVVETSASGCIGDTVEATIVIKRSIEGDCKPLLEAPNIFTPNEDGQNDLFKITGKHIEVYSLTILNRWGDKVFETTQGDKHWDGRIHGRLATEGNYFWIVEYGNSEYHYSDKGKLYLKR